MCLESLNPETSADNASAANAKKAMVMEAEDALVKLLFAPSLMRLVIGAAADSADINR